MSEELLPLGIAVHLLLPEGVKAQFDIDKLKQDIAGRFPIEKCSDEVFKRQVEQINSDYADKISEYSRRYNELANIALNAYYDLYLLKAIAEQVSYLKHTDGTVRFIFVHVCNVLRQHMALSVWKIFGDNNPRANSVRTLKKFLYEELSIKIVCKSCPSSKEVCETIQTWRNRVIAHNDADKDVASMNTPLIEQALDEMRESLNALCIPMSENTGVLPISDALLSVVHRDLETGYKIIAEAVSETEIDEVN